MTYILYTLLSGVISGILSIYFRTLEIRKEVILMPKQLVTQITLFICFALIFSELFSSVHIDLGFIQLGWFLIFVIFSSASYYAVQVYYELSTGNTLFASEEEVRKYLDKLENDRF